MPVMKYSNALTRQEIDVWERKIREIQYESDYLEQAGATAASIDRVKAESKAGYHFTSISDAWSAKKIYRQNLSEEERIYFRLYGRHGLAINRYTRHFGHARIDFSKDDVASNLGKAKGYVNNYLRIYGINDMRELEKLLNTRTRSGHLLDAARDLNEYNPATEGRLQRSLTTVLDDIIRREDTARKTHRDPHQYEEEYFYRISRAKNYTYTSGSKIPGTSLTETPVDPDNTVEPGDIIVDYSLWSTTSNIHSALYRYSTTGESASNKALLAADEEEILFVIENNNTLASMNISGEKFKDIVKSDRISSSEHLIRTRTPFRVVGIQNRERNMKRKIVTLKPERASVIDRRITKLRNPFFGTVITEEIFPP